MDPLTRLRAIDWAERRGTTGRRWLPAAVLALVLLAGLVAAGGTGVGAQQGGSDVAAPRQGISTIGYGEASAPAETAILQMLITREDFGPPRPPRPSATPGAEERELTLPVIDALTAAGLAEEEIEVVISPITGQSYGPGGPGIARLDIALDRPTPERIIELINAAVPVAAQQGVLIGQVGVGYNVEDCRALEREARAAAVEDARERAAIQAELLGVGLGEAVGSADLPPADATALIFYDRFLSGEAGCAPPAPSITEGTSINLPPFDPAGEAEVEFFAQVEVIFAIDGDGQS